MASTRRGIRRRGRSGWLTGALGLAAVAVVGFGLGALAGGLWKAPGLVLSYVFGGTEEVAWSRPGPAAELPPVAAAGASEREEPAPEPAPPPPAPGRLAVQVGAFSESGSAKRLADALRAKGYPVYVSPGEAEGEARWRVRVGPLADREEADRTADRLRRSEKLPTWVLTEDG